jgi:glucosylceramidase
VSGAGRGWPFLLATCVAACAVPSTDPPSTDPPSTDPPSPQRALVATAALAHVATEPTLIVSGPHAYWQEAAFTRVNGSPDQLVDEAIGYQEWQGFGGTFNEQGWEALAVIDGGARQRALELLFGSPEGARFTYGRIPIGASDYAMDRYTLSERPDDFGMEGFSIERDRQRLIPFIKAALAVNPSLHFWASPWTPPAWMKENNSTDGGHIRKDPEILEAYALYLARFVEDYGAEGITVEAVQPQNEPGYEQTYPTCLWTPELLRDFVGDHLGPTFSERGMNTEIWLGTLSAPGDVRHVAAAMADERAARYIRGFGVQWNTLGAVPELESSYGLPIMQTEHRCGNYPWRKERFNATRAPNDHAYAEETWGLMSSWIRAGVSSYLAWNMVLDTVGLNMDVGRPWPQNALLTVDRATRALTVTPAYYVFRHLSQFVDPGARRLGTLGNADALAFANPDGGIVAVLYNPEDAVREVRLGVREAVLRFGVPAHGWATVNW